MSDDAAGIRHDPTLRLSGAQEMRLWHADILADDGVLRIDASIPVEHLAGDTCTDVLCTAAGAIHRFVAPRLATAASHGTGCTLSAAITARLALGDDLPHAVAAAKDFLGRCLQQAYSFPGPLHALNQGTCFHPK